MPAIDGYTPTLETPGRKNGSHKSGRDGYQVNWPKIKALLKRTKKQTGSKFAGFYSLRDSSRDRYFYRTTKLSFSPEALREAHGKMRSFFLRTSRDSASTLELFAAAIPDSKKAMDELSSWISSKKKNGHTIVRSTDSGSIRNRTLSGLQPYPSSSTCYEVDYIVTNVSIDENGKETLVSVTVYYTEVPCGGGSPDGGDDDFIGGGGNVPCSQQIVPGPDCPSACDNSQPFLQPCLDGGGGNPTDPCDSAYPPDYCSKPVKFKGYIDASDLKNYPKANCIYQKLDQTKTMQSVVSAFVGKDTNFNLKIEVGNVEGAYGTLSSSSNSDTFLMKIDQVGLLQRKSIQTAATMLHEAIHAEMRRFLYRYQKRNSTSLPGFPGDFAHDWKLYVNSIYGGDIEDAEHEAMAVKYRNIIVAGLKEYDNGALTTAEYQALAWHGLSDTDYYRYVLSDKEKNAITDNRESALYKSSDSCNL